MAYFLKKSIALLILVMAVVLCFVTSEPLIAGDIPKEIVDSQGNTLVITKPFTKIISLYSAHTENLCSMGAANLLVGISRSDDYPENILSKPRFSYRDDPEKFIGRHPDLVLIRPMIERSYPEFVKKLRAAEITVISLQPTSTKEMLDYWKTLGILSGKEIQAQAMVQQFKKEIDRVNNVVARIPLDLRPKVYFEAIHKKMKTFAGPSIGIFILETAGGINIAPDASRVRTTNIAFFGKEKLLSRGEQIDIFLSQHGRMNPVTIDLIKNEPGFLAIRAVREDDIYLIEEQLVSRPTIRILEGIDKLHTIFFSKHDSLSETQQ
ncbi:MAG: iron complex transport system substrate-binding protein [Desulforhopalus sp.]|jgi:iron complex transport system substrate-binding protein